MLRESFHFPALLKRIRGTHRYVLLPLLILIVLGCVYFSPFLYQSLGNIFFGRIEALYNIKLAKVFFNLSAYPPVGKPAPYAHYQLSRTYFLEGKLQEAVSEAEKELSLYPDHVRTYYILGLTYGYKNDEKKAIDMFSKFIESNPTSWAARNDKAWLQFRTGDIDGALETIGPVTYAIDNPWIQNTYGTLLMNKKRCDEARAAFSYAKRYADKLTENSWGKAYPGNDPRIYGTGLSAMKLSIESNLKLLENK
jgi:tetratricopeptide (TPR) repeat protein